MKQHGVPTTVRWAGLLALSALGGCHLIFGYDWTGAPRPEAGSDAAFLDAVLPFPRGDSGPFADTATDAPTETTTHDLSPSDRSLAADLPFASDGGPVPSSVWVNTCGSGAAIDTAFGVAVSPQGEPVITGEFNYQITCSGMPLAGNSVDDLFVAQYSAAGAGNWAEARGEKNVEVGRAVAVDASGNVFLTGSYQGNQKFGADQLTGKGGKDLVVASFTSSGVQRWVHGFGDSGLDEGLGIAVDAAGNVYLTGLFAGTVNFGGADRLANGTSDIVLASYDNNGVHRWSLSLGGTSGDAGQGVAIGPSGNVYLTGYTTGQVSVGSTTHPGYVGSDILVASYTADGGYRWSHVLGGAGSDKGEGIAVDSVGNVSVTGTLATSGELGGGLVTGANLAEAFITSFSMNGAHRWATAMGGLSGDNGRSIAVDSSGNVYVTGDFTNTASFGGPSFQSAGWTDIFLTSYTQLGSYRWSAAYGSGDPDFGRGVAVGPGGALYLAGGFCNTVSFGGLNATSNGDQDIFLLKLALP